MCALAGVSRSGYYSWLRNIHAREQREFQDKADFALILEAYKFRGYNKGARGIHMRLLHIGVRMNVKKIRRLMKKYQLFCPIRKANPYRRMAKAIRTNAVADNKVKREFKLHGARKILLTDITYIPFNNTFCYLSVIKDAFTEQILSYVLSESLEVDFVLLTVNQLIATHGDTLETDVILHSDQGCHYTSVAFRKLLNDYNLRQSMSRRGNCWDNAPQESFFGHMKDELAIKSRNWTTFEEVKADIDDWMDYYNNYRGQWCLEKLTPNEYYNYIKTGINPLLVGRKIG
ncbi:MAG: IS3 family transposase [Bacteroidales bacterium]|nr:IS3 family transposase [Bacteroidales bacterium]